MKKVLFKREKRRMVNYSSKIKPCTLHKSVDKNMIYLQILIQNSKQPLDCKYIDLYTMHLTKQPHFRKTIIHTWYSACENET